jgi:hypothetical protein
MACTLFSSLLGPHTGVGLPFLLPMHAHTRTHKSATQEGSMPKQPSKHAQAHYPPLRARSKRSHVQVLYSFLVCTRLMLVESRIQARDLKFLLSGVAGAAPSDARPKPGDWLPDRAWTEILQASLLPQFASLPGEVSPPARPPAKGHVIEAFVHFCRSVQGFRAGHTPFPCVRFESPLFSLRSSTRRYRYYVL